MFVFHSVLESLCSNWERVYERTRSPETRLTCVTMWKIVSLSHYEISKPARSL